MKLIKRPKVVKAFASNAMEGDYLPVQFGTNVIVPKDDYSKIANANYEFGLESLEGDIQAKDLNAVLGYTGNLVKYLFQQGVPEYSDYQDYPAGAVVTHNGKLFIALKAITGLEEPTVTLDSCGKPVVCCGSTADTEMCADKNDPTHKPNLWCELACKKYLDELVKDLQEQVDALGKAIKDLSKVKFIEEKGDKYILRNIDGTVVEIPKPDLEMTDASGTVIAGYAHTSP